MTTFSGIFGSPWSDVCCTTGRRQSHSQSRRSIARSPPAADPGRSRLLPAGDIDQLVVVHDGVVGELTPKARNLLGMIDELQLRDPHRLALTPVLVRFLETRELHDNFLPDGRSLRPPTRGRLLLSVEIGPVYTKV